MKFTRFDPVSLDPREVSRRRHRLLQLTGLLAAPAILLMADLHGRTGYDAWKITHLFLFVLLFTLIAFGAAQALIGYFLRRRGGDPIEIMATLDSATRAATEAGRTAVVMPVCNEDVGRITAGLRVIYESLARSKHPPDCDFFLLSDSTDPNCWVAEEAAWLALTHELGAQGRIFYRRRRLGTNKKAGNLADFCRRWGKLYRYMVVLDADSILAGDTITRLVRLMERNHRVGIIQGVPVLVNGETVLARLQQFAGRLYGPIMATGQNYWQLGEANYWGHNAIIRLAPFIRHCSLPELPGRGPFGGRILSHDYVEAALMRRAGWQIWLATDLAGNYEECPATILGLAQRDRRWLQGNLQHARLVIARGFNPINRVHFLLGILSFVASPLWLALLVVSTVIAFHRAVTMPGGRPVSGFTASLPWSYAAEALCLFGFTLGLLLLSKALALLDLRRRSKDVSAFGGWTGLLAGVSLETLLSTLLAPVLMAFHSWFILLTLCRENISWGTQQRGRSGASRWMETVEALWGQTLFGLAAAVLVCGINATLAAWMSPILAGLILSIPLSYFTGFLPLGQALRRRGILQTPEESHPPTELAALATALAALRKIPAPRPELVADYGLMQAVLDPYVNAVHVSLLRVKDDPPPASEQRFAALRRTLLKGGPGALTRPDQLALLQDAESMNALHHELWATPAAPLAEWWRMALRYYTDDRAVPPGGLAG